MGQPTEAELERRRIVGVNRETVTNVTSTDFPYHYPGEDHSWDLEHFRRKFQVKFHKNERFDCCFSLVGVDAAIANAFRRILIAEVPTLAVEDVFVKYKTSIVQDEVLASRLGLVTLKGSKRGLNWLKWYKKPSEEDPQAGSMLNTDYNTIVLELKVACDWKPNGRELAKKGETDPQELYENSSVYASSMKFMPIGQQKVYFPADDPEGPIQPVNPNILLAKLRPGQEIKLDMHCIKGIGADHAKFSPVATATYRLLPTIDIVKPILGKDAEKFAKCFPKGVVSKDQKVTAEEASRKGSGYEGHEGEAKAVVVNAFRDTVSRECLRHEEFQDKVKLGRVRDHFIFSIESTGQFDSDELFLESVRVLKVKCQRMKRSLDSMIK